MKKFLVASITAIVVFASAAISMAGESASGDFTKYRISAGVETSFVFGGSVGEIVFETETKKPDANDIYVVGYGGVVEVGYRFDNNWEGMLGVGQLTYSSDSISISDDAGSKVILDFDDLRVVPIYVGLRVFFSREPDHGLVPYACAKIGTIWMSDLGVDVSFESGGGSSDGDSDSFTWWDSSYHLMYDLGGGVEYRTGSWGFFVEAISRGFNPPDNEGNYFANDIRFNRDGSGWNPINVKLGLGYYF